MVNLSIQPVITYLASHANRGLDKTSIYIASKNQGSSVSDINHDLKALMFNASSIMIISATALAYLKVIYLVTAAALVITFYLFSRVIDETLKPPQEQKAEERAGYLQQLLSFTRSTGNLPGIPAQAAKPWASYFYQDGTIFIGNSPVWMFTKHSVIQLLSMIATTR